MNPIVKRAKTELGRPMRKGFLNRLLYYCPVCYKRLSGKKVNEWESKGRELTPIFCEKCGTMIDPFYKRDGIVV